MACTPQHRLLVSGAVMFLFFGLIPALPPSYFGAPGVRHMYTLHIEAITNALMLFAVSYLLDRVTFGCAFKCAVELLSNVGAWMNVFPWVLGAYTGAVFTMGEGQVAVAHNEPPENNAEICGYMEKMLICCALADILAWSLLVIGLVGACCTACTPQHAPVTPRKKNK
mmetsp:Transcript_14188/g.36241  ORF Transcript_14188/g.36241 Transcript_14188/m.36241 type:complete len:168 (+) Transcript_14188:73-576(+)|eukprot:CAMPEP_0177633548 /NCGR_PEP_ID=MMETSP0447-20121125/2897_1 /TAXON_ID=0 /ORGANISM="Stygamoeba regulata, Strain BSH-02190019" /LENGTH=167 /DNA_ID=CAMNT_0019135217 /DNA_START=59 /DNA_END=562 /DNA_ORIENTATION=-